MKMMLKVIFGCLLIPAVLIWVSIIGDVGERAYRETVWPWTKQPTPVDMNELDKAISEAGEGGTIYVLADGTITSSAKMDTAGITLIGLGDHPELPCNRGPLSIDDVSVEIVGGITFIAPADPNWKEGYWSE